VANIILDHGPPPANGAKDGTDYDRCPRDGCIEVEPNYRNGGRSPRGEEFFNWNIFSADPHRGGCGASWTRTGRERYNKNMVGGTPTQYGVRAVDRQATVSVPSAAYQRNWARAFGKTEDDA
jgi:hypothetical protein